MNVLNFPVHEIRDDNYAQSEVNRLSGRIRANEQEIARLAHDNWLLRLEREGHEEKLRG